MYYLLNLGVKGLAQMTENLTAHTAAFYSEIQLQTEGKPVGWSAYCFVPVAAKRTELAPVASKLDEYKEKQEMVEKVNDPRFQLSLHRVGYR